MQAEASKDDGSSRSQPSAGPITLNILDVARAAKKAFDEGRLSAQGPTPDCRYRDRSGLPCAIGAAIDDDEAARIPITLIGRGIGKLVEVGLIATDNQDALRDLQRAHDNWALAGPGYSKARAATFLATLNSILAEA